MSTADLLREIHALRAERAEAQNEVDQGPQQLKGSLAKVTKAKAAVDALREQLKSMRKESDAKDLQLRTGEERQRDLQGKLNSTTNVKDFNAIKEEIARLVTTNQGLEAEAFEMLAAQDEKQREIEVALKEVEAIEEKHAKLKEVIDYRVQKFAARIESANAKLVEIEAKLEPSVRVDYERATSKRGNAGLAPCLGGSCGSCHSMQTPQAQQDIAMGRVVYCGSCSAMLFKG